MIIKEGSSEARGAKIHILFFPLSLQLKPHDNLYLWKDSEGKKKLLLKSTPSNLRWNMNKKMSRSNNNIAFEFECSPIQ
jgi:hypothetical protein